MGRKGEEGEAIKTGTVPWGLSSRGHNRKTGWGNGGNKRPQTYFALRIIKSQKADPEFKGKPPKKNLEEEGEHLTMRHGARNCQRGGRLGAHGP